MNRITRLLACSLALAAPLAWAAGDKATPEAQQRYQQERARCLSGLSQQDRATCLKEAGAARHESGRGGLQTQGAAARAQNATERCNAQPAADRAACVQRLQAGAAQGSVEGGGVIRQTETPVK